MNPLIDRKLRRLQLDAPMGEHVMIVPIRPIEPEPQEVTYDLLTDRTLDRVRVTEVSEAGVVPQLRVINHLEVRLFLLDGQELIGAKQNRILNADVLVPAASELIVPVSCVEAGRWARRSQDFTPGKSAAGMTRRRKAERVQQSLRDGRGHDGGQAQVWAEVADVLALHATASPTSALSDAYAAAEQKLVEHRRALQPPEGATGMAVVVGGRFAGLDLFDRPETLRHFWESLVDSYLVEYLAPAAVAGQPPESRGAVKPGQPPHEEMRAVIDGAASAEWESFRSPGEGTDLRIQHAKLVGSALAIAGGDEDQGGSLIHLQLFPRERGMRHPGYRPHIRRRGRGGRGPA